MNRDASVVASYGRRGDNNLLHVGDKELSGLEQITGRKFTYNPHTGLPEAFSFADLLPIAAGLAGGVMGGPLGGAAASGLTSAAVSKAKGNDIGAALTSGLMSGVSSYATAGLAQGVGELGATPAGALQGPTMSGATLDVAPAAAPVAGAAAAPTPGAVAYKGMDVGQKFDAVGRGLTENPGGVADLVAKPQGLIALGGTAMGMMTPDPIKKKKDTYDASKYPEQFPEHSRLSTYNEPTGDYVGGISPEHRYFADGGLANMPTRNVPSYADTPGIMAGARQSMGNRVAGSGGGLDDEVPANIEGQEPVRLADGEYIVSSDVVSGLGDGSTDEGVRKLDGMMARVRTAKNGKPHQPGPIGNRVLPA